MATRAAKRSQVAGKLSSPWQHSRHNKTNDLLLPFKVQPGDNNKSPPKLPSKIATSSQLKTEVMTSSELPPDTKPQPKAIANKTKLESKSHSSRCSKSTTKNSKRSKKSNRSKKSRSTHASRANSQSEDINSNDVELVSLTNVTGSHCSHRKGIPPTWTLGRLAILMI